MAAAGCSLLLRNPSGQCERDEDCAARGSTFAGLVCGASRTCVSPPDGGSTRCSSNAECFAASNDLPATCRAGTCVALQSPDCPLVLGSARDPNVVLAGAFAAFPDGSPLASPFTLTFKLAVDEIQRTTRGVFDVAHKHSLILVVCNSDDASRIPSAARHLVDIVGVRTVIATMPSDALKKMLTEVTLPAKVVVLNTAVNDVSLRSVDRGNLVWHMFGESTTVVPPIPELVERAARYVQADPADAGPPQPRLAVLVQESPNLQAMSDVLLPALRGRGQQFELISVPSIAASPTADFTVPGQQLVQSRPDIVVALTEGREFDLMFRQLETARPPGPQRTPFYILSQFLAATSALPATLSPDALGRVAGVLAAGPTDPALLQGYRERFKLLNKDYPGEPEYQSWYDATYALALGLQAAGPTPASTDDIGKAFARFQSSGQIVKIGPAFLPDALDSMAGTSPVAVSGATGLIAFEPRTGSRMETGSVWCLEVFQSRLRINYDILRFDSSSGKLVGSAERCLPGF